MASVNAEVLKLQSWWATDQPGVLSYQAEQASWRKMGPWAEAWRPGRTENPAGPARTGLHNACREPILTSPASFLFPLP